MDNNRVVMQAATQRRCNHHVHDRSESANVPTFERFGATADHHGAASALLPTPETTSRTPDMTNPPGTLDTVSAAALTNIVELACRAPSLHNSQPWRWVFEDAALHLFADHTRIGHRTDSAAREVILSCGVALDHVQVAAAAAGWTTRVERLSDSGDRGRLASIAFRRAESVTDHDRALGESIERRRTDRLAYATPEPWTVLKSLLDSVVEGTVAALDVIDDDGRPALADASRRSEANRYDDESYQIELDWWTQCSGPDDGIPFDAMASSEEADRVDVARDFPQHGLGNRRPQLDRDHSKVLVLSTYDDSHDSTLRCGEVLSRVLLECTAAGFATCTLTHMIELHASREMLRTLIGRHAEPQVLIRVGRAPVIEPPPGRTPRRPIRDVLHIHRC